jgi:hypothetical protein
MEKLTQKRLSSFLEDIGYLKKAIQKNTLIIQQIALDRSLRLTLLFSGFSIIALSSFALIIKSHYHSYSHAPGWSKVSILIGVILSLIISSLLKSSGLLREAHVLNPKISLWKITSDLYSHSFAQVAFPVAALVIFFSIVSYVRGYATVTVSILSVGAGIGLLFYYMLLRLKEYLIFGYWHLITGCLIVLFPSIGPEYGFILSLGSGMFLWGISCYFVKDKKVKLEDK